jgi:hypothetical protein
MSDELKAIIGDRIEKIIMLLYRLGGLVVLVIALSVALKYVWDERTAKDTELIKELRDGKYQTLQIIGQNANALEKSAESQTQVARAVEQLTSEVRRQQNSHN